MSGQRGFKFGAVVLVALFFVASQARAAVGFVQFAAGDVKIRTAAGQVRAAAKGATVDEGDTILAAAGASAQLKMMDGGIIAVRPETELKVDTYRYAGKEDGSERAVLSLIKGGFRTITGLIGHTNKQNYHINTPTAVIGIRGTDHEPFVIPAVAGAGQQAVPPGTYDKVNVGQAYIRTPLGEVNIRQNQVGFASLNQAPTLLPKMPQFFRATPPVRQTQAPKETGQSTAGNQSSSTSSSSSSSTSESKTASSDGTTSGSATATAESRASAAVDNTTTTTPATTPAATAALSTPVVATATAVAPVTAVTQTITATSSSGSNLQLNLTGQTVTTQSGTVSLSNTQSILDTNQTSVLTTYNYQGTFAQNSSEIFQATSLLNPITDDNGNLVAVVDDDRGEDKTRVLALAGGTPGTPVKANGYATTGITLGWQSSSPALVVAGYDSGGQFSTRTVLPDGLFWVRGPSPSPFYLPGVLTGTATYTLDGAVTPRDQSGAAGTFNSGSLSVNFTAQAASFGLDVTTPGNHWVASATGVKMDDRGQFMAVTSGDTTTPSGIDTHRRLVLTRNGSSANAFGNVEGQLLASGLTGAGLTYQFGDNGFRASGAAAFVGAAQDANTSHYLLGMAAGKSALGSISSDENATLVGGYLSGSRTQFSGGYPVRIDAEYRVAAVPTGCTGCASSVTSIPAIYAVSGATGVSSVGTATLAESGSDPATGMVWGRYGGTPGATIGITDRITGASLGTLDVSQQSLHFVASALQSGPISLPVSGTASYTLIGATHPTDNLGNVGTLGSAALTANFTTKTVDAAVNLSIAGSNWSASAASMAISDGTFEAKRALAGTGALTVTKNGSSASTAGQLVGGFTGATGQGAAMLYSLNQGGATGTTVSGVAAFKRP